MSTVLNYFVALIIFGCHTDNESERITMNINEYATYGTSQLRLICNFEDITSLIMQYLSTDNCLNLGLCNHCHFRLFQAQTLF